VKKTKGGSRALPPFLFAGMALHITGQSAPIPGAIFNTPPDLRLPQVQPSFFS
jgi:hypothetical protein